MTRSMIEIDNDKEFLNGVWFSNEANFLLSVFVNSKNWVFKEVRAITWPLDALCIKKSAQCALPFANVVLSPFFSEDNHRNAATVT